MPLPLLRYHDAVQLCRGLRGAIVAPRTKEVLLEDMAYFQDMIEGVLRVCRERGEEESARGRGKARGRTEAKYEKGRKWERNKRGKKRGKSMRSEKVKMAT